MPTFNHDFAAEIVERNRFGQREVGVTHPDSPAHVRLCDDGSVEIYADEGLALLMDPRTRTITLMADRIKFVTRNEAGLRWNKTTFNEEATEYNQPTLLPSEIMDDEGHGMYRGVSYYAEGDVADDDLILDPRSGDKITMSQYRERYGERPVWDPQKGLKRQQVDDSSGQ